MGAEQLETNQLCLLREELLGWWGAWALGESCMHNWADQEPGQPVYPYPHWPPGQPLPLSTALETEASGGKGCPEAPGESGRAGSPRGLPRLRANKFSMT